MKLLVIVDYQNDFVNGSLGFEGAELLDRKIAHKIRDYRKEGGEIILTRKITSTLRRANGSPPSTASKILRVTAFTALPLRSAPIRTRCSIRILSALSNLQIT